VSHDGDWIAYTSDDTGRFQSYIQPFPDGGAREPVSTDVGTHVRWRRDGRQLFYAPFAGPPMGVDVAIGTSGIRLGAPRPAVQRHIAILNHVDGRPHYAVSDDGKRFLLRQPLGSPDPPINVVINWGTMAPAR